MSSELELTNLGRLHLANALHKEWAANKPLPEKPLVAVEMPSIIGPILRERRREWQRQQDEIGAS